MLGVLAHVNQRFVSVSFHIYHTLFVRTWDSSFYPFELPLHYSQVVVDYTHTFMSVKFDSIDE